MDGLFSDGSLLYYSSDASNKISCYGLLTVRPLPRAPALPQAAALPPAAALMTRPGRTLALGAPGRSDLRKVRSCRRETAGRLSCALVDMLPGDISDIEIYL